MLIFSKYTKIPYMYINQMCSRIPVFDIIFSCSRFDWLEIYDGNSVDAPVIGDPRYCGTKIPREIISTGNTLFLRFKTDSDVGHTGFNIFVDCGKYYITNIKYKFRNQTTSISE